MAKNPILNTGNIAAEFPRGKGSASILGNAIPFEAMSINQIKSLNVSLPKSLAQQKLAQHMAILQSYGHSDLAAVGHLRVGIAGSAQSLLQPNGVVLPKKTIVVGSGNSGNIALSGRAMVATKARKFVPVSSVVSLMEVEKPNPAANQKTSAAVVPIDQAYWFGNDITLSDDTTVILASHVKSLFIIANNLNIGSNVTISWERPAVAVSPSPSKPPTPADLGTATTVGTQNGFHGSAGYAAGPGGASAAGQPAPQIELWFIDATGYPAIDLRGQDGQIGITGGPGGDGGRGQNGCPSEPQGFWCNSKNGVGGNGGNGGRGGDGGQGSNGGLGGKFSVFAPEDRIDEWLSTGLTISVDGGSAGAGGEGGPGGNGGPGGAKGVITNGKCGDPDRGDGNQGYAGSPGSRGPDGLKGPIQSNSIQYTAIEQSDFDIEANKPAIISCNPVAAFVGDAVTVNGLRFGPNDKVYCEGYDGQISVLAVTTYNGNNLLQFVVPNVTGGYASIQVVQPDGTRSNIGTVNVRPQISSIVPSGKIRPGEAYFIKGTGLGRNGSIWINNEQLSAFTAVDNNTVKFIARRPSNIVSNPAGESALLKVVNSEGAGPGNHNHSVETSVVLDTFRMLVFGDSVMWGGGLYEHEKFYSLAADYLSSKMQSIGMYKTIKAHHGAPIGASNLTVKPEIPGEMSTLYPTITQQVASLSNLSDAQDIDLVLIDGGANDLPITEFMLQTSPSQLASRLNDLISQTSTYCYDDMQNLLQVVTSQFPKAKVIVTGYYHIFSAQSVLPSITALTLAVLDGEIFPLDTPAQTATKLTTLCDAWVQHSNQNLTAAVAFANAGLAGDPRVFFVDPQTTPSNAAHAPDSLLWEPDPDPTTVGGPTDPIWLTSRQADRETHKIRLEAEPAALGSRYTITKKNSSYHPNPAGAQNYFQKMKPSLDKITQSKRIALKASNGLYTCAEGGGGGILIANRPSLLAWEVFDLVELGGNQVALKASTGHYVSEIGGSAGTVSVNKLKIGPSETFVYSTVAGGICLKSNLGKYLTIDSTGLVSATGAAPTGGAIFKEL